MTDTAHRPPPPEPPRPQPGVVDPRTSERIRLALLVGLFAFLGLYAGWAVLVVIAGVAVMIFFHELGHYLTAKWSGMKVTEFFIGFGPRLWAFQRGETEYGLKLIPAGAYVKIIGMSNLEEVDPADEDRTYRAQSFPRRLLVVSAGSGMHMLMAFVLLVAVLMAGVPGGTVFGMDEDTLESRLESSPEWTVREVTSGSAAARAGIEEGDRIVQIGDDIIANWGDLKAAVEERANDRVEIVVVRDGERMTLDTTIGVREGTNDTGFLGVGPDIDLPVVDRGPLTATGVAVKEVGLGLKAAVGALGSFFSADGIGDYADQVREGGEPAPSSPAPTGGGAAADDRDVDEGNRLISIYGAVRLGAQLTEGGWLGFALFFININIFVGLINMVPLLPFDGGHAAVAIYERIRSRRGRRYRVDMAKLLPITYAVFFVMVLIGVTSLYLDIVNPIDL